MLEQIAATWMSVDIFIAISFAHFCSLEMPNCTRRSGSDIFFYQHAAPSGILSGQYNNVERA